MQFRNFTLQQVTGAVIRSGTVYVYETDTETEVTVYDDAGTQLTQPLVSNATGDVGFAAANGKYDIKVSTGQTTKTLESVRFFDPDDDNLAGRANLVTRQSTAPLANGETVTAGGLSYRGSTGATDIADMPGVLPVTPTHGDHFATNTTPGTTDMAAGIRAALAFEASQDTRNAVRLTSHYDIATPIELEDERSLALVGSEVSNLVEDGPRIDYSGTGTSVTVTAATNANPAVFTATAHGFSNGDEVWFRDVSGGTWAATVNNGPWTIANSAANTFELQDSQSSAIDGTSLGSWTTGTLRNAGAIAGIDIRSSLGNAFRGLVLRASGGSESVVSLRSNDYFDSTDFSGTSTEFKGCQFIPESTDVSVAALMTSDNKFTIIDQCWINAGPTSAERGAQFGVDRDQRPNTLMTGMTGRQRIRDSFIFADINLEQVQGLLIDNSEFDATVDPVRLKPTGDGVASGIGLIGNFFGNDGGADGTGKAAVELNDFDPGSLLLPLTSGAYALGNVMRDFPVGMKIEGGAAFLAGNVFSGRESGNIGLEFGANAWGDHVSWANDFTLMQRNGETAVLDHRYDAVTISGATQANPVVITATAHHFNDGDRVTVEDVGGMTEINDNDFIVQNSTTNTFELWTLTDGGATSAGEDGTGHTAYTSGGTATRTHMMHMDNTYAAQPIMRGHGPMVLDIELGENLVVASGYQDVFDQDNIYIRGGHYEISYHATAIITATGNYRFDVTLDGTTLTKTYSGFESLTAGEERSHQFNKCVHIPATGGANGARVRLRCNAPGTGTLRSKASGTFGSTFFQMRYVG